MVGQRVFGFRCGLRVQRAAHGVNRQPSFLRDLSRNALVPPTTLVFGNRASLGGFSRPRFQQFGIPPDMLVALFLAQVVAVKVLRQLPKLGGDLIIVRVDAVDFRPAKGLRSGKAMVPVWFQASATLPGMSDTGVESGPNSGGAARSG